jgi:Zn-dependent protease with chaperone function
MKKVAIFLAILSLIVVPQIASAITLDVGINYAQATGLGTKDVRETIASIINVAMGLLGIVAVVIILLGGFKWMTASGDDDKVKKAKALIVQGVIGLVIILCAYAIANFIVTSILRAT